MQTPAEAGGREPEKGGRRCRSLLEVMDLVALHTDLDGLLPDLARCLQAVVDFDLLGLLSSDDLGRGRKPFPCPPDVRLPPPGRDQ